MVSRSKKELGATHARGKHLGNSRQHYRKTEGRNAAELAAQIVEIGASAGSPTSDDPRHFPAAGRAAARAEAKAARCEEAVAKEATDLLAVAVAALPLGAVTGRCWPLLRRHRGAYSAIEGLTNTLWGLSGGKCHRTGYRSHTHFKQLFAAVATLRAAPAADAAGTQRAAARQWQWLAAAADGAGAGAGDSSLVEALGRLRRTAEKFDLRAGLAAGVARVNPADSVRRCLGPCVSTVFVAKTLPFPCGPQDPKPVGPVTLEWESLLMAAQFFALCFANRKPEVEAAVAAMVLGIPAPPPNVAAAEPAKPATAFPLAGVDLPGVTKAMAARQILKYAAEPQVLRVAPSNGSWPSLPTAPSA